MAEQAAMEAAVLKALGSAPIEDTIAFAAQHKYDHDKLIGVIKSLQTDFYVTGTPASRSFYVLTEEALEVMKLGSQEARVYGAVAAGGSTVAEVEGKVGAAVYKVGFSQAMKAKWVKLDKATKSLTKTADSIKDAIVDDLISCQKLEGDMDKFPDKQAKSLKRRKLIDVKKLNWLKLTKGENYAPKRKKLPADLTKDMLDKDAWQKEKFKDYNFNATGSSINGGYLHPLLKVRQEFRMILMGMGFEEMPTNRWVESSFWNFDALFQPQSHPARDAHDTFFLKGDAKETKSVPEDYYERVKAMHQKGNVAELGLQGSIGYGTVFKREEAFKNILRTHTTAVSSNMLYNLAQQEGGFKPQKYFSIDRVFRNETMDATHLCEFHQVRVG
jgi:phenylalanyl-tRNA synthetase alpha chain